MSQLLFSRPCRLPLCVGFERDRSASIERAVQQEVQRVEVRQLEALDLARDHALKMPCHARRRHLLDEQRVILGLERNQADVGRVTLVARAGVGQLYEFAFHA